MKTFETFNEAYEAANKFFSEEFGYTASRTSYDKKGNIIEFYSIEDPAMDDTFICIVNE